MEYKLKFLALLGHQVPYLHATDGTNLILIRPFCEALGLDADWQIRELKADEFFGPGVCEHTTQVPGDSQRRAYTCLPERFVYGWLISIKATNTMQATTKANLSAYKLEAYEVLFQHFHGKVARAQQEVTQKASNAAEIAHLKKQIEENSPEQVRQLRALEAANKQIGNPLLRLQNSLFTADYEEAVEQREPIESHLPL